MEFEPVTESNQVRSKLNEAKIGVVPLNWPYDPSRKGQYLAGIAGYGFQGIQISMEQANSPEFLLDMNRHGISPAEQYLAIPCTVDGPISASEFDSAETIRLASLAGVEMLVLAVDGSADRDRCAGRANAGPQITPEGFRRLALYIEKFAILAADNGIKSSFHPHAATFIESEYETRILMEQIDSESVGLCLDAGHWIVGGGDPIRAVKDYGDRITHVHVKDVCDEVLQRMLSGEIETMEAAVEEFKLFVPAGTGLLKLPEFFLELEKYSFSGWLMSEQDSAWPPSEAASGISMGNMMAALL